VVVVVVVFFLMLSLFRHVIFGLSIGKEFLSSPSHIGGLGNIGGLFCCLFLFSFYFTGTALQWGDGKGFLL